MNGEDDILDTSKLNFTGNFDNQVQNILSHVRLTVENVRQLRILFEDLEHALQALAPGCHVHPFGSVVTGLGIKTSDADCYVELPYVQPTVQHVIKARNILKRYYRIFTNVFAITAAKVPIVKFLHIPTSCMCDVSFKSPSGVQNSKLLGHLLHMDRRALPLAILIKYWSKVHKFTGTNLLANYALILMVIFYLQHKNILPPVCVLQRNAPCYMIDNWDFAFDDTMEGQTNNSESLYKLMGGFFKFYSTFNYKNFIISPFMGYALCRASFARLEDLPEEFYLYQQQAFTGMCNKMRTDSYICVQDPFEHNRNCTVAVHNKLAEKIIGYFKFASRKFDEEPAHNVLKALYLERPHIIVETPPKPHDKNKQGNKPRLQNKVTKPHVQPKLKAIKNNLNNMFTQMKQAQKRKNH